MVLAVPPLDESAIFTQIPLSEDLIPLDDLGASGGYGRQLILPDDVPPVLALPWALGPRLPRVNRAEDDGSLHVFVKGGTGLGGPPPIVIRSATLGAHQNSGALGFGFTQVGNLDGQWRYIYGGMLSVSWDGESQLELSNGRTNLWVGTGSGNRIPIATVWMPTVDLNTHTPVWTETVQLAASGPIDCGTIFGASASPLQVWVENFASPVIYSLVLLSDAH